MTCRVPDLNAVAKAAVEGAVQGMRQGLLVLQGEAQRIVREERFATGQLAQAFHTEILPPEDRRIRGTMGNVAPYAPFVEYDTRAHVAPFSAFLPWATAKGFRATGRSFRSGSKAQLRLARIGWAAVRARGTKGAHYMRRTYEAKKDEVVALVRRSTQEAVTRLAR